MPPAAHSDPPSIDVVVRPEDLWRFFTLLRRGIRVRTDVPCSLQELLCKRLEIPADYVARRVQTIFLNGRAVDDVPAAVVDDGAVVTLSAAMPGLVGATLRKSGRLTSLRSSLSYRPGSETGALSRSGVVTVKLFNLICADLAPTLLAGGVVLPPGGFQDFLADNWTGAAIDGIAVRVGGRELSPSALPAVVAGSGAVRLTVRTQP
jgi:hypothetical protein